MSDANIAYEGEELLRYFQSHRRRWEDIYPSERWVIERVARDAGGLGRVLDVGCATGGFCHALVGQVAMRDYTGVDIHEGAIRAARANPAAGIAAAFVAGDIVDLPAVAEGAFDTVFCLGVADWNVRTDAILEHCWRRVAARGRMIVSLRLTAGQGVRDPHQSFQYILPETEGVGEHESASERAPYVVLNWSEALAALRSLSPAPGSLLGYGYWGRPSATARTPYERLVFSVFAVSRGPGSGSGDEPAMELHLPWTLVGNVEQTP